MLDEARVLVETSRLHVCVELFVAHSDRFMFGDASGSSGWWRQALRRPRRSTPGTGSTRRPILQTGSDRAGCPARRLRRTRRTEIAPRTRRQPGPTATTRITRPGGTVGTSIPENIWIANPKAATRRAATVSLLAGDKEFGRFIEFLLSVVVNDLAFRGISR